MAGKKNEDIIELVIEGKDEYSDVSEEVRQELKELSDKASETRKEFDKLEASIDLAETYREQEKELNRLALAQAKAQQSVKDLTKSNRKAKDGSIELTASLNKAKAELASLRTSTNRAQKALDVTKDSMRKYGTTVEEVESQQDQMRQSADKLGSELTELSKSQSKVVTEAKAQVEQVKKQVAAEEALAKANQKAIAELERKIAAANKVAEEEKRVVAESARLTREIEEQVIALKSGDLSWEDYKRRVGNAGRSADLTGKQVAEVNKALDNQLISARKAAEAVKAKERADEKVARATAQYRVELDKLANQYREGRIAAEAFEKGEAGVRRKLGLTERQVEKTRAEMRAYVNQMKQAPLAHAKASGSTDALTKVTRRLAQAYTVLLAAQKAVSVGTDAARSFAETEEAMLGVQKTTNLTAGEIQGLADEMKRLSTRVTPTTKNELLGIAEAAGRMGIQGAANILAFTQNIDALSSATGLAGEETAQAIAQILNVTGEAQSNVAGVSASIAELGNTSATTEDQIVHFAKRLATDTATINLTSAEVLGLGAGLAELGVQAEGASTVVGRTFRRIEEAIKEGGKPMEDLQRVTGKTSEELIKAFGEDKIRLFTDFVSGLDRMQDGGATLNGILTDMGLKSDENARILGLLSQRHEGLQGAVDRSNKAFEEGNAHIEEMAKKAAGLLSGFQKLQNKAETLRSAMGEAFSDDLVTAMGEFDAQGGDLEETFAEIGEGAASIVESFVGLGSAVGGVFDALGALTNEEDVFAGFFNGLLQNLELVSSAFNLVVGGIAELGIRYNEFFENTEDVDKWRKVQEDAFGRIQKSVKRYNESIEIMEEKSSRAFNDLKQAYEDNADSLERLDESQRQAIETIIKEIGYLEGSDKAYRQLTRAMQKAAEEKKIIKGMSEEESVALESQIELLVAQGVSLEEATKRVTEKAQAEKAAADAKTAADAKAAKSQEDEKNRIVANNKLLEQSFADLGQDMVFFRKGISESTDKSVAAIQVLLAEIAEIGEVSESASIVMNNAFNGAIDGVVSSKGLSLLEENIKQAWKQGVISQQEYLEHLDKIKRKSEEVLEQEGKSSKKRANQWKELADSTAEFTEKMVDLERVNKEAEESIQDNSGALDEFRDRLKDSETRSSIYSLRGDLLEAFTTGRISAEQFNDQMSVVKGKLEEVKNEARRFGITLAGETPDALRKYGSEIARYTEELMGSIKGAGSQLADRWWAAEHAMRRAIKAFESEEVAVNQVTQSLKNADEVTQDMIISAERSLKQVRWLGDEKLAPLRNAIKDAKDRMDALKESSDETRKSLQDELDALLGNEVAIEKRRYEAKRRELDAQLREARQQNNREALDDLNQSLSLLQQIHQTRMADLETQKREREQQKIEQQRNDLTSKNNQQTTTRNNDTNTQTVVLQLGNQSVSGEFDANDASTLMEMLGQFAKVT